MLIDILRRLLIGSVFCLVQAVVLSRLRLFDCVTPMLFVYFVVMVPRGYPHGLTVMWGFLMGLAVDTLSNTPGMTSAALTLTAFVQPWLIELFLPRDAEPDMRTSAASMGWTNFTTFTSLLVLIFCLAFFTIEAFSWANWQLWLASVTGSTVLTLILIFTCETFRRK